MKTKTTMKKLIMVLMALVITTACSLGAKAVETVKEAVVEKPVESSASTALAENPGTVDLSILGNVQRADDGGFAFRDIPGYELSIYGGMVTMLAPGASPDIGPVVQLIGWKNEVQKTNDQLYEELKRDTPMQVGDPLPIMVAGRPGLAAEINGDNNGSLMQGKVAMVMVTPYQQFVLMLGAPQDNWATVVPYFDALLGSVDFFEMVSAAPVSSLASGKYAYTNSNVVRDVVVYRDVAYIATLGGMVGWNLKSGYPMKYTPLQGMAHVSSHAITLCNIPETRIIVGTMRGLSIYDPSTGLWEQRQLAPEDSRLENYRISRLYCDQANDRLLIGYSGLGVLDLKTGAFQRFTKEQGLAWDEVTDIAVAGKDIWVASGIKGIARITDGKVSAYTLENGLPTERTRSVVIAKDGTVWVGASNGLLSFKGGKWNMYGSDLPAKLADINELEITPDGKLWAATAPIGTGRLCQFNPASGSCDNEHKDSENQAILALTQDETGALIYGTSRGLYRYDGSNAAAFKSEDQLVSNFVDAFAIAPDGMLWVGMDGGIQILDPADPSGSWTTFTRSQTQGLGGNWATAIAHAPDGTVWVAVINGEASRYQNGSWTSFPDIYSFDALTVDRDNRAWFGDNSKGIVVLNSDGSLAMNLTSADGLPSDSVYALLTDAQGVVWIGTDKGLAKYEQGKLQVVFGEDDTRIPNRYIRDLALAPDGALLIGTFTGLARFDGTETVTLIDLLKSDYRDSRLITLAASPSGRVWIGTDKGLLYSDDLNTWSKMTIQDGLLTNGIAALLVDPFGAVWVGGGSNISGGGLLHIVP